MLLPVSTLASRNCAVLHWIILTQMLEPREAHVPVWSPPSRSGLPSIQDLSPWWAQHLPSHTSAPIHVGSRVRGPERPNTKGPERELAPSSKARVTSPYQAPITQSMRERESARTREHGRAFPPFTLKGPPFEIP